MPTYRASVGYRRHLADYQSVDEHIGQLAELTQDEQIASCACPLTAALAAIGGRWSLKALQWIAAAPRGFNELQRLMPSISHKVLSQTLRTLEQHRLVVRCVVRGSRLRTLYSVSVHGRTVLPVLEAIREWGHTHIAALTENS